MTSIKLIPKIGIENVPFGISKEALIRIFGYPINQQKISDIDGYPKSRYNLFYEHKNFLLTPELGFISMSVDTEQLQVNLWDTSINDMSANELINFLKTKCSDIHVTEPNGWYEQDIISNSHGIIASFCEDKLEYIEVSNHIKKR